MRISAEEVYELDDDVIEALMYRISEVERQKEAQAEEEQHRLDIRNNCRECNTYLTARERRKRKCDSCRSPWSKDY